jgi:hypothetical protein
MSKIKEFFVCFLSFICINAYTQNLVPNSSFEIYYDCTQSAYQLSNSVYWRMMQSPDYFNTCVIPDTFAAVIFDVPNNAFGTQFPDNGNGYAGFAALLGGGAGFREYMQAQLLQALDSNRYYCVDFKVSLSDSSVWAVKKIGAYFSQDTINPPPYSTTTTPPYYYAFVNYIPQIESNSFISDTANWTTISGAFQAIGTEKYLTIGNFRENSDTDTFRIQNRINPDRYSYYYVDNITVEEIINANAGNDTSMFFGDSVQIGNNVTENAIYLWTPSTGLSNVTTANPMASPASTTTYVVTKTQCSVTTTDSVVVSYLGVGVNENARSSEIKVYPNPNDGNFNIESNLSDSEYTVLELFDILGRQATSVQLMNKMNVLSFDASVLPSGTFQYRVISSDGKISQGKLIIIR